jgi:arylsulfatase A
MVHYSTETDSSTGCLREISLYNMSGGGLIAAWRLYCGTVRVMQATGRYRFNPMPLQLNVPFVKACTLIVCTGLVVFGQLARVAAAEEGKRPNIVLVMADDLGYECIGANGSEYKTPNLDKLAAGGVRFTNCFANPLCTPSRVKIMTGQYNVRNYVKFGLLPRGEVTFAHQLKKAGYATAIAGKWQLGKEKDAPQHFGFDESCLWQHTRDARHTGTGIDSRFSNPALEINGEPVNYNNGEYGPRVCADFLCTFIEKNKDRPFLVYFPMILTHCPFFPTPDSKDWDPKSKGSPTYKGDAKYFGDMATYMDRSVGQIVAKLDELGLRESTLVIFTGDNGTDKPVVTQMDGRRIVGGKGTMADEGTRVPLIASWPGAIKKGLLTDELVDFTDMMPTLCEATGAALPEGYPGDGRSILPTLRGEPGRDRPWVYVWYRGQVFARNGEYSLVGKTNGKNMRFLQYTRSFDAKELGLDTLTDEQKTIHAQLQGVIDDLAKTRKIK